MKLAPHSLYWRIVLYFLMLLAAVLLLTRFVIGNANMRIAADHTADELKQGERILLRVLDDRGTRLQQAVSILVADFAFRKTVATADPATMQSALSNHGGRLRADTGLVISDDKRIVTSFGLPGNVSSDTLAALIDAVEKKQDKTWIALIGGKAIQFAVAPILMPDPNGWVAFGFVLDDGVAVDAKQLTELEVSFLVIDDRGQYRLSASTLPADQREELQRLVTRQAFTPGQWPAVTIGGHPWATTGVVLERDATIKAAALIQKSIEESVAPFQALSIVLTVVALLGALAGLVSSVWIARAIAKPIEVLTDVTNRIRLGEQSVTVPTHFTGEIGQLASGFEQMNREIEKREAEILRMAFIDPLTQLPNRAGLVKAFGKLQAETNHKPCLALALMDIARLQHINDGLGYRAGDQVITSVAARLSKLALSGDVVARTDGGAFGMLLRERNAETVEKRMRALVEDFASHQIEVNDQAIDVELHLGWATAQSPTDDANTLFRCAEIALQLARVRKISPIQHDVSMDVDSTPMLGLLSELRRAVSNNEFVLYYQPKLTLAGIPTGAEALVRWNHPTRGLLGPQAFIEFAEQSGTIRGITRYLIKQALIQSAQWDGMGLDMPIAVNISARDLQDESFPDFVKSAMQSAHTRPNHLKFEITERALLDNVVAAERALKELGKLGIRVSLDDYGTGYATLSHLSRLMVSELKIDRSFITGLTTDSRNYAIALTTVELAHRLGMKTVAEGVETIEELNALQTTGCDEMQGYLFARPMPADAIPGWKVTHSETRKLVWPTKNLGKAGA